AALVFRAARGLVPLAAVEDLQQDQLAEQGPALGPGRLPHVILDPRPLARLPGQLEAVAHLVDPLLLRERQRVPAGTGGFSHGPSSCPQVGRITRSPRLPVRGTRPDSAAISSTESPSSLRSATRRRSSSPRTASSRRHSSAACRASSGLGCGLGTHSSGSAPASAPPRPSAASSSTVPPPRRCRRSWLARSQALRSAISTSSCHRSSRS